LKKRLKWYQARALGYSIFTEADTFEQLKVMALDAVNCHFDAADKPLLIRLHMSRMSHQSMKLPRNISGEKLTTLLASTVIMKPPYWKPYQANYHL